MRCKHCGRSDRTELARREFDVSGDRRFHVGVWCKDCKRFSLPWLKQKPEHRILAVKTLADDGVVPLTELMNPTLFKV